MSSQISLESLYIYPVKSLAGISLETCELDDMGLKYDRRWMLVSPEGGFLSQRNYPKMALIQPHFKKDELVLSASGMGDHVVPSVAYSTKYMRVNIWNDQVEANHISDKSDAWLSKVLEAPCHLVYIGDDVVRQCDEQYAKAGDRTGFSDGFPLLLISEASLEDLNSRLETPVPMKRFRPNLVVKGCNAFAEDEWKIFQVGGLNFRVVKPCSRCVITAVNPDTGIKSGAEPLKTLSTYRRWDNKVYFGQNVIHDSKGVLSVNDVVKAQS